ncbi:MAG: hypothetical protein LBK65_01125 [Tannerellaceae bacterium]|jgi:hypothetical protein|nr:hypothetical protein [Tannerellaceae bacterium]
MKTKYNKSRVMRNAWTYKKDRRFGRSRTFSQCLKWAWDDEKKLIARTDDIIACRNHTGRYSPENTAKRQAQIKTSVCSMAFMADTLTAYYANNRYNGD